MSLHSRPIPAPKPLETAGSTHIRTATPVLPEQLPAPEPIPRRRSDSGPDGAATSTPEVRAEPGSAEENSGQWYRREPWLAVMLAGFVPLAAAIPAPDAVQYPLLGLTVIAVVIGSVMLVRQGVFGPPPGSNSRQNETP